MFESFLAVIGAATRTLALALTSTLARTILLLRYPSRRVLPNPPSLPLSRPPSRLPPPPAASAAAHGQASFVVAEKILARMALARVAPTRRVLALCSAIMSSSISR